MLHWLEIRPRTDPMGHQRDNLQKRCLFPFVKNMIITYIPNGPKHSTHFNPNMFQIYFRNSLEPIPKKVVDIFRWCQAKRHVHYSPNIFAKWQSKISVELFHLFHKNNTVDSQSNFSLLSYLWLEWPFGEGTTWKSWFSEEPSFSKYICVNIECARLGDLDT